MRATCEAIGEVVAHPVWLHLSGRAFALLGAGAEMGPTEHLLSWGAEVLAVDIPVLRVWERLKRMARDGAEQHVPARPDGGDGADLTTEPAASAPGSSFQHTVRTEDGRELGIADNLILQQGPNYALVKRLQRWRALVAPQDVFFSAVVAPRPGPARSPRTASWRPPTPTRTCSTSRRSTRRPAAGS